MTLAVWLGSAAPVRSQRWLDGAIATAAALGDAIAIAAGDSAWLELADERAARGRIASIGIPTTLRLDYLGWAQIAAAAARHVGATTVLVDEASRPERWPEVAAIAELMDAAQLGGATTLIPDGAGLRAVRAAGQTVRLHGLAVIGLRIAAETERKAPRASASVRASRLELSALGLDPLVLAHRAVSHRGVSPHAATSRKTIDSVADHLAVYLLARGPEH